MSFALHQGRAPLLVSMPHLGTLIPAELQGNYVSRALATEDSQGSLDSVVANCFLLRLASPPREGMLTSRFRMGLPW